MIVRSNRVTKVRYVLRECPSVIIVNWLTVLVNIRVEGMNNMLEVTLIGAANIQYLLQSND